MRIPKTCLLIALPVFDFKKYKNFAQFQEAVGKVSLKKVLRRKGNEENLPRLSLDIGCTLKQFNKGEWKLDSFKDKWDNLRIL